MKVVHGRVVHQDIKPPESREAGGEESRDIRLDADVAQDSDRLSARFGDLGYDVRDGAGRVTGRPSRDHHRGSGFAQRHRGRLADSFACTCDDSDLSFQWPKRAHCPRCDNPGGRRSNL